MASAADATQWVAALALLGAMGEADRRGTYFLGRENGWWIYGGLIVVNSG